MGRFINYFFFLFGCERTSTSQVHALQEKLLNQETEISNLYRKLIELYEELRKKE
jgi:hypothetical protein